MEEVEEVSFVVGVWVLGDRDLTESTSLLDADGDDCDDGLVEVVCIKFGSIGSTD